LTLETLGQANILQSFPTCCTRHTLRNVNTWSTKVKNKAHQAWCLKRLVKQASCSRFLLVVLDRLCTMLTLEARLWRTRYTKLEAWSAWSSRHLEDVSYSLYLTVFAQCYNLKQNGEEQGTPSLMLEKLGQADILQMFPTHNSQQSSHSVNTWSKMVNNKVHQAWGLKRLVKQTSWRCFLLVVLNILRTVLPLEAHWWRTWYTKLDAWKGWSSGHLADVSYS